MATQEGVFQGMFQNEVKSMMYIFGDIKTPSTESALLIESITLKLMRDKMKHAAYVCNMRCGRSVSVTDILFLFRKDKTKLRRLVKHIELRDVCKKTSSLEEDSIDYETGNATKKERYSLEFLTKEDIKEILSDEVDEVQKKRLENLDNLTKGMNVSEYKEFSETRQANFHKNMAKFKEWLDLGSILPPSLSLDQNVYSVLGYLAYDTVQEIVELSLLMKSDQERLPSDLRGAHHSPLPYEGETGPMFFNIQVTTAANGCTPIGTSPDSSPKSPAGSSLSSPTQITMKPKPRKRGRPPKNSTVSDLPMPVVTPPPAPPLAIQPIHVHEAVRRYTSESIGPMIPYKTYFNRPRETILQKLTT